LTALANLVGGLQPTDLGRASSFLALALAVGFVEEVYFRGLMLRPLLARGTWRAVMVSTVLFGAMHLGRKPPDEGR
jgi:membrane protease YdiL (CAAX protease family)